jgi:hypothetical protein
MVPGENQACFFAEPRMAPLLPGLTEALRRTRPDLEKLLAATKVPPLEAYELLLAALRQMSADLEGAHLDRLLIQEVRKSLSTRRERDKLRLQQGKAWIDLLVQAGIVPMADRATWLRTIGAHTR